MPSYELHLVLVKNKKRCGGSPTVGLSRIPALTLIHYFQSGWSIKRIIEDYPQLKDERDGLIVLKELAMQLKKGT